MLRKDDNMAKYDREFLVPYLEDVCALHLSKQKLIGMIGYSKREIERIQKNAVNAVEAPKLEAYRTDADLDGFGMGCLGVTCGIFALIALFAFIFTQSVGALLLALILGALELIWITKFLGAEDAANKKIKERNDEKEADHALSQLAALAVVEPKVEAVKKRIRTYEAEIGKVDNLLEKLYGVNVIPRWYRDLYPAVYLYDWFSNSRADDLDLALNTLVLEQIKDKLDTIIQNQSEMIINQRIMIANQRKTIDQIERHNERLMSKLNQIGASVEDQNMYLGMIEANTAASAYFAAANYLKQ